MSDQVTAVRRVAFIVNGAPDSPMGTRAQEFARRLAPRFDIRIAHRAGNRMRSILALFSFLRREQPEVCYVFDIAYSGVIAALVYKAMTRVPLVVDTGDAIYALARSAGLRGPVGLGLTWLLEEAALRFADHVVVRGTRHRDMLARRGIDAVVVHDGIDTRVFGPTEASNLRAQLGLDEVLSVGFVGSLVWSDRLQIGYGWDLVEVMRLLRGEPFKAILIGAGTGLPILKGRAAEYGLGEQMVFLDPVPWQQLPRYLGAVDVWLSTQTNDVPGNVRTTGKLPMYLAAGCYVLASDVGEAGLLLPSEMLVEYRGVVDQDYPARLAERLRDLARHPERIVAARPRSVAIAREHFDYDVLSRRLDAVLDSASS